MKPARHFCINLAQLNDFSSVSLNLFLYRLKRAGDQEKSEKKASLKKKEKLKLKIIFGREAN